MSTPIVSPSRYFVGRMHGEPFLGIEFNAGRAPIRHSWRDDERIIWVRADQREEVVDLAAARDGQLALSAFVGPAGLEIVQIELFGTDQASATPTQAFVVHDRLEELRQQLWARGGHRIDHAESAFDAQRMRGFVGGQTEQSSAVRWADTAQQRELLRQAQNEAGRAGVSLTWVGAERAQPSEVRREIEHRQRAGTLRASVVDERFAHAEGAPQAMGGAAPETAGLGQEASRYQKDESERGNAGLSGEARSQALQQLQRDHGLTQVGLERLMGMSEARTGEQLPDPGEIGMLIQRLGRDEQHEEAQRPLRPSGG